MGHVPHEQSAVITEYEIDTPGAGPYGITKKSDGALWFTEIHRNASY